MNYHVTVNETHQTTLGPVQSKHHQLTILHFLRLYRFELGNKIQLSNITLVSKPTPKSISKPTPMYGVP